MSNGQGAVPTWEGEIKSIFTEEHVACMNSDMVYTKLGYTIDLSDYEVVKEKADVIYFMISQGRMPPGQPLPQEKIDAFYQWMQAGCPKNDNGGTGSPNP